MKTISGTILASKPITVSKAASSMNSFLSMETGASTAVSSYLRRCAAAFNELVHKELKGGKSERKRKQKKKSQALENANAAEDINGNDLGEEHSVGYPENSGLGSIDEEERIMERKKKKKNKSNQTVEIEIEVEDIQEKKKRKKPEIEDECLDNSEEQHRVKKRKH